MPFPRIGISMAGASTGQATLGSFNARCSGDRLRSIAVRNKEPPACDRGLLLVQQGGCLPADLEAGSATRAAARAAAQNVTAGDQLDPKRTIAFVVRGGAGLAKCI